MSKPPPVWSELWRDVITHDPTIQWPVTDEMEMELLGEDWLELGTAYVAASDPQGDRTEPGATDADVTAAWSGGSGAAYGQRLGQARDAVSADGEGMQTTGQLAIVFAEEIRRTKDEIDRVIDHHEEFYLDLTQSLWAWFHPAESRREAEAYRVQVAGDLRTVIAERVNSLESRIGGR